MVPGRKRQITLITQREKTTKITDENRKPEMGEDKRISWTERDRKRKT